VSEKNVETIRRFIEEFGVRMVSGDAAEVVAEFWDPRGDYYPVRKFPDARPRHGSDEITSFFRSYAESWESYDVVILRMLAVGDDRVFVHSTIKAEGRGTGMQLEGDIYHSVWLRHGRILRLEDHLTERGAMDGGGLSPLRTATTGRSGS
jgi:hypothetical protein